MPKLKASRLSPEFQAAMAIAVAANLCAYFLVRGSRETYFALAVGLNIIGLFFFSILSEWLIRWKNRDAIYSGVRLELRKLAELPWEDVRQQALDLLADSGRFRSVASNADSERISAKLGPALQDFFRRFETVEEVGGEFKVGRKWLAASTLRAGYLRIGLHFDGAELIVRDSEDTVYIVHDTEHPLEGLPSIYHQVLLLG